MHLSIPLIWTNTYGEAFHYGFTFSTISPGGAAVHQAVNCKDFLTDLWWAEYMGKPANDVYGFSWKPGQSPGLLNAPRRYLALDYSAKPLGPMAAGLEDFLRAFDKGQDAQPSQVAPANEGQVLLVTFDPYWTSRPYLISAYASLLRTGCGYEEGDIAKYLNDKRFLCQIDISRAPHINPRLLKILRGETWPQQYSDFAAAYIAHNEGGILNWRGFK